MFRYLFLLALGLLTAHIAIGQEQEQFSSGKAVVSLQPLLTNLTAVTVMRFATPPGWDRPALFIAEQHGRIWWFDYYGNSSSNGTSSSSASSAQPSVDFHTLTDSNLLLDISSELITLNEGYDERGLIGMEFHPEFALNGRLWVWYSAPAINGTSSGRISCSSTGLNSGAQCEANGNNDHTNILAEYRVPQLLGETQPPPLEPSSSASQLFINKAEFVAIYLTVPWPFFNHNSINALRFNAIDRRLYFAFGDGGCAYDPFENAQNLDLMFGKVMSLDLWNATTNDNGTAAIQCTVPVTSFSQLEAECPAVSQLLNLYAVGIRNPSGISFFSWQTYLYHDDDDEENNSTLSLDPREQQQWAAMISDVGQDNVEKVSVAYAAGQNFGWSLMEGTLCVNRSRYDLCTNATSVTNETIGSSTPLNETASVLVSLPVTQLFHGRWSDRTPTAILGGAIYNGSSIASFIPELVNKYLYVSLSSVEQGSGRLYMFDVQRAFDQGAWNRTFDAATCSNANTASPYSIENWETNPLNALTAKSKIVGIDYDFYASTSNNAKQEQLYAQSRYFKAIGYTLDRTEFLVSIDSEVGLGNGTNSIYKIVGI